MAQTYDRGAQDIGNIVALEHVNVRIPSQQLATAFYVVGLGFTRDPYLMVGLENMWINVGQQQFHLPTADPQVLRPPGPRWAPTRPPASASVGSSTSSSERRTRRCRPTTATTSRSTSPTSRARTGS